jgi:DNA processing protein
MTESDSAAVGDEVLLARAYLSRVAEPASGAVWRWVERLGPIEAAEVVRSGRASDPVLLAATEARRTSADAEADLDAAARLGLRLIVPESTSWPHFALGALGRRASEWTAQGAPRGGRGIAAGSAGDPVPPVALWVCGTGDLASVGTHAVAVVGARAATSYGQWVTGEFCYELARAGIEIVSGGAYGIDARAHRAALAAGQPTTLVSAGGLDRPYPSGNSGLYEQVAAQGLLISESPPGSAPHRGRFLTRNRIIAAFGTATLIVEAAVRSGALNTAAHARLQGRPVLAVPGPVSSAMSAGCHALLRRDEEPATLASCAQDVLDVVGPIGQRTVPLDDSALSGEPDVVPSADARDWLIRRLDGLDPMARQVFNGLPRRRAVREDELAVLSGISPIEVLRALPMLRLAGLIESDDRGIRISPDGSG